MDKLIKKIISFSVISLGFFLKAQTIFALEVSYPSVGDLSLNTESKLGDYVCYLFGIGSSIGIAISTIVIAWGGIYYLVSLSRSNFTSEAKDLIKSGILGLLVTLCSVSIIYTINPNLTNCKLGALTFLDLTPGSSSVNNSNVDMTTYQEIPIGTLTETLLTRTIGCYAFDMYGDPIEKEAPLQEDTKCSSTSDCDVGQWCGSGKCKTYFPTYTNHDRADCITQLADGAQKKTAAIAKLSDEIAKLMQQCSCEGKCNPTCSPGSGGCATYPGGKPLGVGNECSGSCSGACVDGECEQPEGTKDCCPEGVKEIIEHGPINILATDNTAIAINNPSNISKYITASFIDTQINKENIFTTQYTNTSSKNTFSLAVAGSCTLSSQCGTGKQCLAGQCVAKTSTCSFDSQCSKGQHCLAGNCEDNTGTCSFDSECGTGKHCSAGYCMDNTGTCSFDSECASGQHCDPSTHTCIAGSCTYDLQCNAGQKCTDGKCVSSAGACKYDYECPAGQKCDTYGSSEHDTGPGGKCVIKGCTTDFDCPAGQGKCDASTGKCGARECTNDLECNAGQDCTDGKCVSSAGTCKYDLECPAGQKCDLSGGSEHDTGEGGRCVANTCTNDLECNAGKRCIDGKCAKKCSLSSKSTNSSSGVNDGSGNSGGSDYTDVSGVSGDVGVSGVSGEGGINDSSNYAGESGVSGSSGYGNSNNDGICPIDEKCDPDTLTCEEKTDEEKEDVDGTTHGLDEFRCPNPIKHKDSKKDTEYRECDGIANYVEEQVEINGKEYTIINKEKWDKLSLIQQLNYYKPEIDDITTTIQYDEDTLDQARTALSKCYLAIPYVDLLKTAETTDKNSTIILTEKPFSDPLSDLPVQSDKYCDGFTYVNSSCLNKCNNLCPDSSKEALSAYADCSEMSPEDTKDCVDKAYKERPCPYGSSKNFGECISSCQTECNTDCEKKYFLNTEEYDFCNNQCNQNGQCVLNNSDKCLYNANNIVDCTGKYDENDQGNIDYCINRAYLCKNGSDQYSGYQDCVNTSASQKPYSASYLYSNPKNQKCVKPYSPPNEKSDCYSTDKNGDATDAICRDLCPETQKCPTDSRCGTCSCDNVNTTIYFSLPNESNEDNVGQAGFDSVPININENQMVGPQCNKSSYNDDPLTFYCMSSPEWWDDPKKEGTILTPIGEERICPLEQEIPVGQTVDNAKLWANDLIRDSEYTAEKIQIIVDQMLKLGEAIQPDKPIKDYCMCGAKFEDSNPICKTGCNYNQWLNGNYYGSWLECSCTFEPCKGSPCLQMTDYISDLWNKIGYLKSTFINFYTSMIEEPRSDIMKQLTYSRQTTDNCSVTNSAYGINARLLSCTRVEDELIPPINTGKIEIGSETIDNYCYGTNLGEITNKSLTDNWFCCQQYATNPEININSIYNQ